MAETVPLRRVQRIRHETRQRDVVVSRVEQLSPHFVSITFSGEALEGFSSQGFDDHVKFILPDGTEAPPRRDYTPRRFDAARHELTIEFLLHGHGLASTWAASASPGAVARIGGPKNSMVIPTDYSWHLLAGDETALPAIHRRLEELPTGVTALVALRVADAADQRQMESDADLKLSWLSPDQDLVAAIRDLGQPAGDGFVWCAGEASEMIRARQYVLEELRHPHEAMRVSNYWHGEGPDGHA